MQRLRHSLRDYFPAALEAFESLVARGACNRPALWRRQ